MYSAEDFIEMRKNAHRGMWFSTAILSAAAGIVYFTVMYYFAWLESLADWSFNELFVIVLSAGGTMIAGIKGYYKQRYPMARSGHMSDADGGDGMSDGFGGFGDC